MLYQYIQNKRKKQIKMKKKQIKIKKTKNGTRDERVIQWRQKKNKNVSKMRQKRDKRGTKILTKWRQKFN